MMSSRGQASETSPLLGPQHGNILPEHAPEEDRNHVRDDEDVLERQHSIDDSRAAQFAGNPEVTKQLKFILPAVSIGVFLSAADQTIIASSYGKIGSDLQALNLTSWIATSYFLTLTSFQPLYGKLSDIFGRKVCLLYGYAIFGTGCMFCGLSQDINQLIAARVWQGIGGGGMTTVVSIMLSDVVPLKDRGMWQGVINIIYASGAGTGAPLGGFLADTIGWRWSFLGQAPLCLIAFIAVFIVLKLPQSEQQDWRKKLRRIDFLGAIILVIAACGLIFGLDRGSNVSWKTPISYVPLIIAAVSFSAFILVEMKAASEPFAPGHIIFKRTMFACYMCNFFAFSSWLSMLYYAPLFYQAVQGQTATGAAVRILPAVVASVSGSLFGGWLMKRTGKYYWLTFVAYSLLPTGVLIILLSSGIVVQSTWAISVGLVVGGFGSGIGVTTSLIALISNAAPEDQAVTTACSYLFRSLGSVMGIAISATFIQQQLRQSLKTTLGSGDEAAKLEQGVRRSLDFLKSLPLDVQALVRDAYGEAVRRGFAFMLGIALGATIASFFIQEKRLTR